MVCLYGKILLQFYWHRVGVGGSRLGVHIDHLDICTRVWLVIGDRRNLG
jgi:hypothetical protein